MLRTDCLAFGSGALALVLAGALLLPSGCAVKAGHEVGRDITGAQQTQTTSRPSATSAQASPVVSGGDAQQSGGLVQYVGGTRQYAANPWVEYADIGREVGVTLAMIYLLRLVIKLSHRREMARIEGVVK